MWFANGFVKQVWCSTVPLLFLIIIRIIEYHCALGCVHITSSSLVSLSVFSVSFIWLLFSYITNFCVPESSEYFHWSSGIKSPFWFILHHMQIEALFGCPINRQSLTWKLIWLEFCWKRKWNISPHCFASSLLKLLTIHTVSLQCSCMQIINSPLSSSSLVPSG